LERRLLALLAQILQFSVKLVFKAMGWPTDGLGSAIPDAIKDFRNRQKNTARLSK
jgi:hypothetical protein